MNISLKTKPLALAVAASQVLLYQGSQNISGRDSPLSGFM